MQDAVKILAEHGASHARLRLWVDPADGCRDRAEAILLTRPAKRSGVRTFLDLHFSDTWARIPSSFGQRDVHPSMSAAIDDVEKGGTIVTMVEKIKKAGGTVTPDGTPHNPNHATVSGITEGRAEQPFQPTLPNPVPKADRGL